MTDPQDVAAAGARVQVAVYNRSASVAPAVNLMSSQPLTPHLPELGDKAL
jgi:hypothetical protein